MTEPAQFVPVLSTDEQPKAGLMWLCRGCGDGLVSRGAEGSGYCRECFAAAGDKPEEHCDSSLV